MSIGHDIDTHYALKYGSSTREVEQVSEVRDLGIVVSDDLKWSRQCNQAAYKAMAALGMIKRTFTKLSKEAFKMLYSTYVRPHLEYCVQAWSPYYQKDINILEKVQRRATKMVHGMKNLSYDQRLKSLNLFSLERRRIRGDLIEAFKILNQFENVEPNDFFRRSMTTNLRGHSDKLFKSRSVKLCRRNFFSQKIVDNWNSLPQELIDSTSVDVFKRRLDLYMDNSKDMGNKS